MQRLFRLSLVVALLCVIGTIASYAQLPQTYVSGRVAPGHVRVFTKDSVYIINNEFVVGGTLIVEPGTTVYFYEAGRLIDSTGGRIIADGYAYTNYNANPGIDPVQLYPADQGGFGYADMRYFLHRGPQNTINVATKRDLTVNSDKYNHVFNVVIDTVERRIYDLVNPNDAAWSKTAFVPSPSNPNRIVVPFEYAIMFINSRMYLDPNSDPNLKVRPWQRLNQKNIEFNRSQIRFIGQPQNNFSREWGHIVVLPGARAAFFRDCKFEGFRKDTTVDRKDYYAKESFPTMDDASFKALNNKMRTLANGAGGAFTTFSSRTWLLNCTFSQNEARNRGGALQILQTPNNFPAIVPMVSDYYPVGKNPALVNKLGDNSEINTDINNIDNIDSKTAENYTDEQRQAYDDARVSVFLGRMRNLKFDRNKVILANIGTELVGNPPVQIVHDMTTEPANYPQTYGNKAFGGAIYIAGEESDVYRDIEIAFGLNNKMMIDGKVVTINPGFEDSFEATMNQALNYQEHMSSFGARGGAIYVGANTSLMVAGLFSNNSTSADFLINDQTAANNGYFSMGGAIYVENSIGRLQVHGGPNRATTKIENVDGAEVTLDNSTYFYQNTAGAGGAIYVDGNVSDFPSPIIGGTDNKIFTREYGFNIKFVENSASSFGGAIFSKRNMSINGAGGTEGDLVLGYGGNYPVTFRNNEAGFAGGAVALNIPTSYPLAPAAKRTVQIIRANFESNMVGMNVNDITKPEIRGGGAIYSMNADINVIKGSLFEANTVHNGNGGAIAMINPNTSSKRFVVSDLDAIDFDYTTGLAESYTSVNAPFTYSSNPIAPDAKMLTRFYDNKIELEDALIDSQMGTGTTQIGKGTPVPTEHLMSTVWMDSKNGYAVGQNGKAIRFSNSGAKWEYLQTNITSDLTDVHFTTDEIGYAVGAYRTILKTTDKGTTWTPMTVPAVSGDPKINDINFVGTETGYAVADNGYIFTTTNAGQNWVVNRPANRDLFSIAWTGVAKGFVVGERGLIMNTTNGGASWDVLVIPGLTTDLNTIVFKSANVAYAAGKAGVVIKTTDAGLSWDFVDAGTDIDFKSMYFRGQSTAYLAGENGTILKSINGGDTWTSQTSTTTNRLNSVYFVDANVGFVAGNVGLMLGTTDGGANWKSIRPADETLVDVKRFHQETTLPENGIGLGGAIYVLDAKTLDRVDRADSISFNRVRIQGNEAFTGSAIYSDNYDLKFITNRCLITSNTVDSRNDIGLAQNAITGPVVKDATSSITANHASSDLASATIYAELQGPLPSNIFSEAANSIYANNARFLVRLPDAANTKGVLAGTTGIGLGGTDTLRGNYWGATEANLILEVNNNHGSIDLSRMETFFIDYGTENYLPFMFPATTDKREQGPFESIGTYAYTPISLANGTDENTVGANSIDEKILFSGRIYDIYDKGTDIKTADYSKRRMSPIEDFAVGIAPTVKRFNATTYHPSNGKYVKRWLRDPFAAEALDANGEYKYKVIADLQGEWKPEANGTFYHPIGYPLFLESMVDYSGDVEKANFDKRLLNEQVFFVINETTGDFIRVNMKQVSEDSFGASSDGVDRSREVYRTRVELVPDSTNRNSNSTIRRTAEGLLNLGSNGLYPFAPYSNPVLLEKLYRDAYAEDAATLQGRKYSADYQAMARVNDLYSNRPGMPTSNYLNGMSNTTYFAGERYHALPVDTGDVVRVISRTVLWREGVLNAYNDGIVFKVVRSVMPPIFTGDIPHLQNDTIIKIVPSEYPNRTVDTVKYTQLLNKIFVTENRAYPVADGWYSIPQDPNIGASAKGRDRILTVTAIDSNGFTDPRAILFPDEFTALTYDWYVSPESGLSRWMMAERIYPSAGNPTDGANGHLEFKGQPLNPYVVPGGEDVVVTVYNYPPHWRTVDVLKQKGVAQDVIDQLIYTFPRYFNAPKYDVANARFLQQDTIDYGSAYKAVYNYKLFVTDSVPRFLNPGDNMGTFSVRRDLATNDVDVIDYVPSVYTCSVTDAGALKANLTSDKLRFQVDFNTDDEQEDAKAINWDFRYGKTAYGFRTLGVNPADNSEVEIDWWNFTSDPFYGNYSVITQTRPTWMANNFMVKYDDINTPDTYGVDFSSKGQLNYRINRTDALTHIKKGNNWNLDTIFTVVAHDGHGGVSKKTMKIEINVAPEITNSNLPEAIEDQDYNLDLLDTTKKISVFDPNWKQTHTYEILYVNDARYPSNKLAKDPCFPEAGEWDLTNLKTAPAWLKINSETGLLYGTPRVTDAPKSEKVTVIVWDSEGLPTLKTFDLEVVATNHNPEIAGSPDVRCIDVETSYIDSLTIKDIDLLRTESPETLTLKLIKPDATMLTLTPNKITGPLADSEVKIAVHTNSFNLPRDPDGKVTISVQVTDKAGATDTVTYRLQLSEPVNFVAPITVRNNNGAFKVLSFGTAEGQEVSTGDGTDGQEAGKLDAKYCEYEIPPVPPNDVFDARWTIPVRNGVYRNIYPTDGSYIYNAKFQAGGEEMSGSTSILYPVTISWNPTDIPAKTNTTKNPAGSTWYLRDAYSNGNIFNFEMTDPKNNSRYTAGITADFNPTNANEFVVTITNDRYDAFVIVTDLNSGINDGIVAASTISNVTPNPVSTTANINFSVSNDQNITMDVYDALGNRVATIANGFYAQGQYNVVWNVGNLANGTYTVRLVAGTAISNFPVVIVE